MGINDRCGRDINYLRISVTDRCNFRCMYCMPEGCTSRIPKSELLTYGEIIRVVRAATELGVSKIRITGGEPLVRKDLTALIAAIADIPGITDLALTTNGSLLGKYARSLKAAGLSRVNVSLDTLREKRFARVAGVNALEEVLAGIKEAQAVGLSPVKINMVVMRGINDDELAAFARLTIQNDFQVRFIEYMPFNQAVDRLLLPVAEMKRKLAAAGLTELISLSGEGGTARTYSLPGAKGSIGFIAPVTDHFCDACNRMRLTADGRLKPCLLSQEQLDIKALLRGNASHRELMAGFRHAVSLKPDRHNLAEIRVLNDGMFKIGG